MKILIADDHALVLDAFKAVAESQDIFHVDTASGLREALKCVAENGQYDLIILDYNMPEMDCFAGLREAKKANAPKPVALMSGDASQSIARSAVQNGAQGFIPKTMSCQSIFHAAEFMISGEVYVPVPSILRNFQPSRLGQSQLVSSCEPEILEGLVNGWSNKEIAAKVGSSEFVIKLNLRKLFKCLGARNRSHAAALIARSGVL